MNWILSTAQPRRILAPQVRPFRGNCNRFRTFTGAITAKVSDSSIGLAPELALEELVRQSKPAVAI